MVRSRSFGTKAADAAIIGVLGIAALLSLLPLLNMIAISFSSSYKAASGLVTFFPLDPTLKSYQAILKDAKFFTAFWVSVKRVFLAGVINFFLTISLAYPLSKEKNEFKYRDVYMWVFVFTMMFSGGLVPWYMTIKSVGLIDSIWALVLPGAVNVYNVILVVNFFRNIPKALDESASIDGAGALTKLLKIYVPLSVPVMATITLFSVVANWNSFFDGLMLMNNTKNWPLQTYVQQLVITIDPTQAISSDKLALIQQVSDRTLNAAKIVVTMMPILAIYPFLQRYFITGITIGSVKE